MGCLDERFKGILGNPDIVYSVRVFSTEIYCKNACCFILELHGLGHTSNTDSSIVCLSKGVGIFTTLAETVNKI